MLQTSKVQYVHEGKTFEGYYVIDDNFNGIRPAVLVAHAWDGRNDFACQQAEALAELGYAAFALDMYGDGYVAKTIEEKMQLIKPMMDDRKLSIGRVSAAFETLKKQELVNSARIAAMGYCFGGMCVLDLARSGAEIRGVVSFHGLLKSPPGIADKKILAKIIAFHGNEDPMVPPEQVHDFENEMTKAGVDWQIHIFGNTYHAFTNPKVHDLDKGLVYNKLAAKRSWTMAQDFFKELFS